MDQMKKKGGDALAVKTWRERMGVGPSFPLHLATDVERAMEAEIENLRTLMAACAGLIANDSYAATFQSMAQYRTALLEIVKRGGERSAA